MKKAKLYEVRKIESIRDMVESSCEIFADRTAYLKKQKKSMPYEAVTYAEFKKLVWNLGTKFLEMGLSGKKIAIISENRFEWAITYMATVCGDMTVVPIDLELAPSDLTNLIKISKASAVVYTGKLSEKLISIKSDIPELEYTINMDSEKVREGELDLYSLIEEGKKLRDSGDTSFDNITIDKEAARILLFTSGTTALSKGVLLSHKNIATNLMSMCSMVDIKKTDVFLATLPIHHTYASTCGIMAPLYRGSCVAFADGLKYILNNLKESKTTVLLGVPAMFELIHKRIWAMARQNGLEGKLKMGLKLSGALRKLGIDARRKIFKTVIDNFGGEVRLFISGAAAIEPSISKSFHDMGILFLQGYGITECAPIVALNRDIDYRDDAIGLPLPGLEVKVINKNEEGVGEIICKGDNVMLGYYENQEATDEVIKDGWFYTGDYGKVGEDGFIRFEGRKKNIIIAKNGKNVYPEELETMLSRSDYVNECMVYGHEDEDGETYIHAQIFPDMSAVELKLGTNPDEEKVKELIQSVVDDVNKNNPVWKYIRKTIVRKEEFEKTTTKKIKRFAEANKEE
jgi:long-chain acyl-CoA synthetase